MWIATIVNWRHSTIKIQRILANHKSFSMAPILRGRGRIRARAATSARISRPSGSTCAVVLVFSSSGPGSCRVGRRATDSDWYREQPFRWLTRPEKIGDPGNGIEADSRRCLVRRKNCRPQLSTQRGHQCGMTANQRASALETDAAKDLWGAAFGQNCLNLGSMAVWRSGRRAVARKRLLWFLHEILRQPGFRDLAAD